MKGIAITAWLGLVVLLGAVLPTPVDAIPAFARKYRTSCMTCHVAYPKLNMYGEVFRLNGYQVPEVEDELKQDDDISLGADSWKRVWPNGVWPGTIPGTPPLAVRGTTDFQYDDTAAISREFKPPSVTLFLSGSLQEDISAYMGFHLFEGGEIGSLGRMFIQFSSLLSNWQLPTYALNIRFGQFIPDAVPFANHRGLTLTPYATNTYYPALGSTLSAGHAHGGGGSGFLLESLQVGVEARGVIKHRVRYVIGMVNGSGAGPESNSAKDGYVRLAYKLGGIGFDGSGGNAELNNISGYVDNAITIGGFGYLVTGRNDEEVALALERQRRSTAFHASTSAYHSVMRHHGWEEEAMQLRRLSIDGKWDEIADVITDEMLDALCVVGTWDEIAAKMREKYSGLCTIVGFSAQPENEDEAEQIRAIIDELRTIPALGEVQATALSQ